MSVYDWKSKCVAGITAILLALLTLLKKKYIFRERHAAIFIFMLFFSMLL
jgi:hypothetical protein